MTAVSVKILIVDDEAPLRRLTIRMLGRKYDMEESSTANEALDLIRMETYDLILVDHTLPDLNGNDLVKRIRTIRPTQRVVYVSGHSRETCLTPEEQNDASTGFLQKPYTRDVLERTVETFLPGGTG